MKKLYTKNIKETLYWCGMLFLFLYAFRKVNQGIDVTDTGYHFSNFLYMSEMDPMWIFSTYLSSVLGHIFTLLPGGNTLLGLNIYTTCLPALLGVIAYIFFTKVIRMHAGVTFIAVFIALSLCWCPTTCVYNYLTYLLFALGAVFLYKGLQRNCPGYLVAAGVCLGLNVMVRFPNLAEAALIVVVWYTCFLRKSKWMEYVRKTGWCLAGYLAGIGVVLAQIAFQYGLDAYIEGIIRLLGMTGDASEYTLYSMVINLIRAYIFSGRWIVIMALCVGLGIIGFMIMPKRLIKTKIIGYGLCCLVLVRWFYGQGMFSLAYEGYGAIQNWGAAAIILALLFGLWIVVSRKAEEGERILAAVVIVIIGITPLGSNNQLYANMNFLFLILPFVFYCFTKVWKASRNREIHIGGRTLLVSSWPFLTMTAVCFAMLLIQSTIFGNVFVFRDEVPRNSEVTSLPSVAHMKTNEDNAVKLQELAEYATEAELSGRQVLLYGDVPALSAYLRMPFVLSPWPDLPSYSNATFAAELTKLAENIEKNRPILILGADFYDFLTNTVEDKEGMSDFTRKHGYKLEQLSAFIEDYAYTCTFVNEGYAVLE